MVTVLIANRERYETNGMEWLLKSSNPSINIFHACTFSELQVQLESKPIDILILEIEFVSHLEQNKIIQLLKVLRPSIIGLTIQSTFEIAQKAIDLGVKQLLVKPVSPEQLQRNVQALIRERKSQTITINEYIKKSEIRLPQLFNDDMTPAKDMVFIGFKTENRGGLNRLYSYLNEYSFQMDCDLVSLPESIIGVSRMGKRSWFEECQQFLRDWQSVTKESISIVILLPTEKNASFHERYKETIKMLEVTFFIGFNQVQQSTEAMNWRVIDPFLTSTEQKLWINFLNHSDLSGVRDWLYQEFLHFELPYPEPGLIRIRLTSILAQIRRYLKENTIFLSLEDDYLNLFNQVLYSSIIYRNVQELILFTSKIFSLKEQVDEQKKDIIDSCHDYIQTQYWNSQLSLEGIAMNLNRNPSYLSSLFVRKTGRTFREALNDTRIANAKRLLKETEMSIKEISGICGFTHQQYFTRVFRRIVDQTPNQFRSQK